VKYARGGQVKIPGNQLVERAQNDVEDQEGNTVEVAIWVQKR